MRSSRVYSCVFTLLFLCVSGNVEGQSSSDTSGSISLAYPVYSQYLQNGMVINPAYTGTRGALSGFLSYRKQWLGTAGAPVLQSGSLHAPFKNDKVALGLLVQFMQYGYTNTTSIYGSYAYHIRLAKGKLSFGLRGGVDIANSDFSDIVTLQPDEVFTKNDDPYILPNVGAGVYYFSDKLFAGISIPQFMSYKKTSANTIQAYHSINDYDFIFSGGGLITFSDFFKFKPSVLVHYALDEAEKIKQFDINGNFILADVIWLGGSWRTNEEVVVGILQFQINPQLMFGLSYDYPLGRMSTYSNGSAEFALRYEFGSKVSAANPRYF
ncbi:MAG TPA: PorP/SprF family type IX secretion system membrane protein [Bacteroidales bacterium]|nr:PorP/SprF family type IX secretion system membrane protein [Bacteroidales bacterium]